MEKHRLSGKEWLERIVLALLFIALGALIIIVFSPLRPRPGQTSRLPGTDRTDQLFCSSWYWFQKNAKSLERYSPHAAWLAYPVGRCSLSWIFASTYLTYVGVNDTSPIGFSLLKLNEVLRFCQYRDRHYQIVGQ